MSHILRKRSSISQLLNPPPPLTCLDPPRTLSGLPLQDRVAVINFVSIQFAAFLEAGSPEMAPGHQGGLWTSFSDKILNKIYHTNLRNGTVLANNEVGGAAEATGLGFVCFVYQPSCIVSQQS